MKLRHLPIGIQSFKSIREDNYLYVDKTKYCCEIAESGKFYFLSRPRRFGKSLTLHTFKEMFLNRKDLFEGLYAYDNWTWGVEYPVFHIQFNILDYTDNNLEHCLSLVIKDHAEFYQVQLSEDKPARLFQELIQKLHAKYGHKVVVLIDEYDKPIIDYLTKDVIETAKVNRDILRNFYGVLKASDELLRFVFITGISKFSHTGIFSQLNNLRDLTLDYNYAAVVGYTQVELNQYFTAYLEKNLDRLEMSIEEAWAEIKRWYNGYTWNMRDYVYNPHSILSFMIQGEFKSYWFMTGGPKFLIDYLKDNEVYTVDSVPIYQGTLDSYDIENLNSLVLMFQTGYLTLKEKFRDGFVVVGYPNQEVEVSMLHNLLTGYTALPVTDAFPTTRTLGFAFRANDAKKIVATINALFASMPYDLVFEKTEKYYQAIIYLAFKLLGQFVQSEVKTSDGRMDAVVETDDSIWILEFKLDQTAEIALRQIIEKDYAAPFKSSGKKIHQLGINFSSTTKKVDGWEVESL